MNWDAIGAVGELVGAFAVILTLGYLAIQVKQNTLAMRVAAKQEMTKQFSDYSDLLLENPDLLELDRRTMRDNQTPGSELEVAQVRLLLMKATWYFSSMYFQFTTQSLSDEEWHQSKALIARYCHSDDFKSWWQESREDYPENFRAYIESHWN